MLSDDAAQGQSIAVEAHHVLSVLEAPRDVRLAAKAPTPLVVLVLTLAPPAEAQAPAIGRSGGGSAAQAAMRELILSTTVNAKVRP